MKDVTREQRCRFLMGLSGVVNRWTCWPDAPRGDCFINADVGFEIASQGGESKKNPPFIPLSKSPTLIFLSPGGRGLEVRGNCHPHPGPLPSREREIKVMVFHRGKEGDFSSLQPTAYSEDSFLAVGCWLWTVGLLTSVRLLTDTFLPGATAVPVVPGRPRRCGSRSAGTGSRAGRCVRARIPGGG
jgi:hypothetical protein